MRNLMKRAHLAMVSITLLMWTPAFAQPSPSVSSGHEGTTAAQPDFRLQVVPAIVYKVDDPGNVNTSSFVFNIAVLCSTDCELTPISARVELSSAGSIVESQDWTREMLGKIKQMNYRTQPSDPFGWPIGPTLPEAFDLFFYFRHPQALAIDSAAVRLTVADAKGHRAEQMVEIPIRYYQQKTALIVPFRGHGMVGQDWITSGGHHQSSNAFGIDLDGLDEQDGELSDVNENAADAGWGREILAPAGGTVVYVRNDVPENPHPGKSPGDDYYRPLHDPVTAYAGNCVIIDHGNTEYSVMMHMQTGSVIVKVGDRVATGQVIGRLGSSGSSGGPHVHYQLQTGPRLWQSPCCRSGFKTSMLRFTEVSTSLQNRLGGRPRISRTRSPAEGRIA